MQPHLTTWQIIRQSEAIHPDWDAETHLSYLLNEEGRTVRLGEVELLLEDVKRLPTLEG